PPVFPYTTLFRSISGKVLIHLTRYVTDVDTDVAAGPGKWAFHDRSSQRGHWIRIEDYVSGNTRSTEKRKQRASKYGSHGCLAESICLNRYYKSLRQQ